MIAIMQHWDATKRVAVLKKKAWNNLEKLAADRVGRNVVSQVLTGRVHVNTWAYNQMKLTENQSMLASLNYFNRCGEDLKRDRTCS